MARYRNTSTGVVVEVRDGKTLDGYEPVSEPKKAPAKSTAKSSTK